MRHLVFGILLSIFATIPASAQNTPSFCNHTKNTSASPQLVAARRVMKNACAADRASLCQSLSESCGGPMRCLRAHIGQLSPDCAGAIRNVQALRASGQ